MKNRAELEYEKQNNRFLNHFFKDLFGKTIAAKFIYQYLRAKGPGSWKFDFNLPTFAAEMREPNFVEWYINRPFNHEVQQWL